MSLEKFLEGAKDADALKKLTDLKGELDTMDKITTASDEIKALLDVEGADAKVEEILKTVFLMDFPYTIFFIRIFYAFPLAKNNYENLIFERDFA